MKGARVRVFLRALGELIDSLDATLQVDEFAERDEAPPSLRAQAELLPARLGSADRLAAGVFKGNTLDTARVSEVTKMMRQLDQAYLEYRRSQDSDSRAQKAGTELAGMLDRMKAQVESGNV
ncbi:MAG: hypothetical protein KC776_08405 [Myxococcales bacterium]|nr:hypothetical protein [Myxococcales bacterium]